MNHPDEGVLQALLDEELLPGERVEAERHLERCSACREELGLLRNASGELAEGLRALDRAAPVDRSLREVVHRRRWSGWRQQARRSLPRAAVILIAIGTVASATVPGSPLRDWIDHIRATQAPAATERGESPSSISPATAPSASVAHIDSAGVSVAPESGRVRVVLRSTASGVRIRVRMSDGRFSDVKAYGQAAAADFRTSPGRIEVTGASSGEVEISISDSALAVVEVNGRAYLRKDRDGIHLLAPASDSSRSEIVFTVEP